MRNDLEERTLVFSKKLIFLCKKLPWNIINKRLVDQIIRSGTSVGANYREANETDTPKDFRNRIRITKKEAKETLYWIDLIIEANREVKEEWSILRKECEELLKITATIYLKAKKKS